MKLRNVFVALILLSLTACGAKNRVPSLPPGVQGGKEVSVIYHQVRYQGETLGAIAKWYTGDARNWKKLAAMNPAVNPDRIYLDQVIKVPRDIAVKTTPYNLIELRRTERALAGLSELTPVYSGAGIEKKAESADSAYETGPLKQDPPVAKHEAAASKEEAPKEVRRPRTPISNAEDEEQERRREQARQDILREMLKDDAGRDKY